MAKHTIFSWDHAAFPVWEVGDSRDPDLVDALPKSLVERLYAWSARFNEAWDYETGFVVKGEPQKLDAEFRVLADELRKEGIEFEENPWWRDPEYM